MMMLFWAAERSGKVQREGWVGDGGLSLSWFQEKTNGRQKECPTFFTRVRGVQWMHVCVPSVRHSSWASIGPCALCSYIQRKRTEISSFSAICSSISRTAARRRAERQPASPSELGEKVMVVAGYVRSKIRPAVRPCAPRTKSICLHTRRWLSVEL